MLKNFFSYPQNALFPQNRGGYSVLDRVQETLEKACNYYGTYKADGKASKLNANQLIITTLCDMMVRIWGNRISDIRPYQPTMAQYNNYLERLVQEENKLDSEMIEYDNAKQVIQDCRKFLSLVVLPRI